MFWLLAGSVWDLEPAHPCAGRRRLHRRLWGRSSHGSFWCGWERARWPKRKQSCVLPARSSRRPPGPAQRTDPPSAPLGLSCPRGRWPSTLPQYDRDGPSRTWGRRAKVTGQGHQRRRARPSWARAASSDAQGLPSQQLASGSSLSLWPSELAVGPGWDLDLLAQASQRQASMWCLPAHSPSPQASDSPRPALDARSWPGFLRSKLSCQAGWEWSQSHVATGFSTSRETSKEPSADLKQVYWKQDM